MQPIPFATRLKAAASRWDAAGRPNELAFGTELYFIAQCWLYSGGRHQPQHPEFDPMLADFVAACRAANGGDAGWDALLRARDDCRGCGETYRVENLSVCPECQRYYCYSCTSEHRGCDGKLVG